MSAATSGAPCLAGVAWPEGAAPDHLRNATSLGVDEKSDVVVKNDTLSAVLALEHVLERPVPLDEVRSVRTERTESCAFQHGDVVLTRTFRTVTTREPSITREAAVAALALFDGERAIPLRLLLTHRTDSSTSEVTDGISLLQAGADGEGGRAGTTG